jgi:hypothetical protein
MVPRFLAKRTSRDRLTNTKDLLARDRIFDCQHERELLEGLDTLGEKFSTTRNTHILTT